MVHYIKMNAGENGFISLVEALDASIYSNIGTSLEDYYENKYVMLSAEQYQFHLDNPKASVTEVWNMQMNTPAEPTYAEQLRTAKSIKLAEIEEYSHSENVDQFTVNGGITGWLTPIERSNYLQSLTSAELLGESSVEFFVGGHKFALPIANARYLLARIQRYADASFIVTMEKKVYVESLTDIDEVNAFDITTGYPPKLEFEL